MLRGQLSAFNPARPENLVSTPDGRVLILDDAFGSVRRTAHHVDHATPGDRLGDDGVDPTR